MQQLSEEWTAAYRGAPASQSSSAKYPKNDGNKQRKAWEQKNFPHNSQACGPPIRGGGFGTGDRTLLSNLNNKRATKQECSFQSLSPKNRVKQKILGSKTPTQPEQPPRHGNLRVGLHVAGVSQLKSRNHTLFC